MPPRIQALRQPLVYKISTLASHTVFPMAAWASMARRPTPLACILLCQVRLVWYLGRAPYPLARLAFPLARRLPQLACLALYQSLALSQGRTPSLLVHEKTRMASPLAHLALYQGRTPSPLSHLTLFLGGTPSLLVHDKTRMAPPPDRLAPPPGRMTSLWAHYKARPASPVARMASILARLASFQGRMPLPPPVPMDLYLGHVPSLRVRMAMCQGHAPLPPPLALVPLSHEAWYQARTGGGWGTGLASALPGMYCLLCGHLPHVVRLPIA